MRLQLLITILLLSVILNQIDGRKLKGIDDNISENSLGAEIRQHVKGFIERLKPVRDRAREALNDETRAIREFWQSERARSIREKFGDYFERAFESFAESFKRHYNSSELPNRMLNYIRRKQEVDDWNKKFDEGQVSFAMDANGFADWTDDELNAYKRLNIPENMETQPHSQKNQLTANNLKEDSFWSNFNWNSNSNSNSNSNLPSTKSWERFFPPIRDQGSCGSCYAFATVDTVMASKGIQQGSPISTEYSTQQIVDCSRDDNGCGGGWPTDTLKYIQKVGGIAPESSYPYKARKGSCQVSSRGGPRLHSASPSGNGPKYKALYSEADFKEHIANRGPVIAAMHASNKFNYYLRGIFDDSSCFGRQWNHAVIVAGYGTKDGKDYWIIRNSYGTRWGQQGYMWMLRGKHLCRIGKMGWGIINSR